MGTPRFTWGDAVRVKACAPTDVRAGECGDVVAVTEIDSHEQAERYAVPIGNTVYQVEFGDGQALEIREAWLEAVTE